jgi:hypothetical protein
MFLETYRQARSAFLDLAAERGAYARSDLLEQRGAEGETLAMDVAIFGRADARKALLLICGTHGLEGGPGSALLRSFIQHAELPADDIKIVAVHALNPWGFSHASRNDHDNIDVNRNFVDFTRRLPDSKAYGALHPALCPDVWTDGNRLEVLGAVQALAAAEGLAYALNGATAGQYSHADGLNYGGTRPCWSHEAICKVMQAEFSLVEKIGYIEWHTGVGSPGELLHIVMHEAGSEALERTAAWWGHAAVTRNASAIEGAGETVPDWQGILLAAIPALVPHAKVAGAVIEMGTFGNQDVLEGLMIDRWLRFGNANSSSLTRTELSAKMRNLFAPADPGWQAAILERGVAAQHQALKGLAAW